MVMALDGGGTGGWHQVMGGALDGGTGWWRHRMVVHTVETAYSRDCIQ
jgi:hypothetical protein